LASERDRYLREIVKQHITERYEKEDDLIMSFVADYVKWEEGNERDNECLTTLQTHKN
jgi:hypothetical protein